MDGESQGLKINISKVLLLSILICIGILCWWMVSGLVPPSAARLAGLLIPVVGAWIFEILPLSITSVLAATFLVILRITHLDEAFSPFAHPLIFLFFGGFLVAGAMSRHQFDRRIALSIVTSPWVAGDASRALIALWGASLILSMWLSNSATCAMMLPIALGVVHAGFSDDKRAQSLILIGVAYSTSIGGVATPVGSPPNLIALAQLKELAGIELSFLGWMAYGVPLSIICGALLFFILLKKIGKSDSKIDFRILLSQKRALGQFSFEEKALTIVTLLMILMWVMPKGLLPWFMDLPEPLVAVLGASALFLIRNPKTRSPILRGNDIQNIDWGTLLLFGGGLSLGGAFFKTGLAGVLGDSVLGLSSFLGSGPIVFFVLITVLILFTVFFTELVSNTATANILIPLTITFAIAQTYDPLYFAIGVAFACTLAFMMPISTPPNAIVYGSKKVLLGDMLGIGLFMNFLCAAVLIIAISFGWWFGFKPWF